MRSIWKNCFMKDSMPENDDIISMKTEKFITFHAIWISNEDT
jgi:hypothetical protein